MAIPTIARILEELSELKTQWRIGVFVFFTLSLYSGLLQGIEYTILWAVFGIVTLICITQAYPDVWHYTFWLIGIYAAAAFGSGCLLGVEVLRGRLFGALGILSELAALCITFGLMLHVKDIRDKLSRLRAGHRGSRQVYVPLGLWALAVLIFYFAANLSVWGWVRWATERGSLAVYIISEIAIITLTLYILWLPQEKFEWGAEAPPPPVPPARRGARVVRRPGFDKCPVCGGKLVRESRKCPSCARERVFHWCRVSEGYIIICRSCRNLVPYGREKCISCGEAIEHLFPCRCGGKYRISEWVKAG